MVDDGGELVEPTAAPPDGDGLRHHAERLSVERVRGLSSR